MRRQTMLIREFLCADFDINTNIKIYDCTEEKDRKQKNLIYKGFGTSVEVPDNILDMQLSYMTTDGDCIVIEGISTKKRKNKETRENIGKFLENEREGYMLLQIIDCDECAKIIFSSLKELERIAEPVNIDNYETVYTAFFDSDYLYGTNITKYKDRDILEHLFEIFNVNHPDNYKGRSMSVSDVVLLRRDGKTKAYFCDPIGFQDVTEEFLENAISEKQQTITRESLDEQYSLSSYNENTEEQMDYYIDERACEKGDKAYLYSWENKTLEEMTILHCICRSNDPQAYDKLLENEDVLLDGEDEYDADTSAEFITDHDCYLVWFRRTSHEDEIWNDSCRSGYSHGA